MMTWRCKNEPDIFRTRSNPSIGFEYKLPEWESCKQFHRDEKKEREQNYYKLFKVKGNKLISLLFLLPEHRSWPEIWPLRKQNPGCWMTLLIKCYKQHHDHATHNSILTNEWLLVNLSLFIRSNSSMGTLRDDFTPRFIIYIPYILITNNCYTLYIYIYIYINILLYIYIYI